MAAYSLAMDFTDGFEELLIQEATAYYSTKPMGFSMRYFPLTKSLILSFFLHYVISIVDAVFSS